MISRNNAQLKSFALGAAFVIAAWLHLVVAASAEPIAWPEPTQSARPWTRWWWHGSAVDEANLSRLLEEYQRVGLGGVEITCIYGVQGNQQRNLAYRSGAWIDAVKHTIAEAKRLGLGVDLPAGSGWRMGGPGMTRELGNSRLVLERKQITGPATFEAKFEKFTPQAITATDAAGRRVELTDQITDGAIEWAAPEGDWQIDIAGYRWAGDRVKRPAPGGEGININPFWRRSVDDFLGRFSETLGQLPGIRAQFHDSFEYEGDWQPEFFDEFERRRGYRLQDHLAELSGAGEQDRVSRVKADYRETLADLILDDFILPWVEWSHGHDMLARNQSHGSPANWLDLYASCDIPETESFGRLVGGDANPLVLKFASSAANVAGRKLVSAETATWLDEHFHVSLAEVKQLVDRQMLGGVNHILFHGTAYSPEDAAWPGWLFYASTQINPQNSLWRDLPALCRYITRCQSLLQDSQPDNNVLLYWPLHDTWHDAKGLRKELRVHNSRDWFEGKPLGEAAHTLQAEGYAFDYVSDRLLAKCRAAAGGKIRAAGGTYSAVVVPHAKVMPQATLEKLADLAEAGCQVIFLGELPSSLPGLKGLPNESQWADSREKFSSTRNRAAAASQVGSDLQSLLAAGELRREAWAANSELSCLRRTTSRGTLYFICNQGKQPHDDWITPAAAGAHGAVLMDPASGRIGRAVTESSASEPPRYRVQLEPLESVFLLVTNDKADAPHWVYQQASGPATELDGKWGVRFVAGGPTLPASFETDDGPAIWTERGDAAADAFAGTARYVCEFDAPGNAARWRLDLGEVFASAQVRLNGEQVATLVGPSLTTELGALKPRGNKLEIDVTNLAANRIRDLDRRGVRWRIFEDINLVTISYRKFDASNWPVRPAGLQGPVTLTPLSGE